MLKDINSPNTMNDNQILTAMNQNLVKFVEIAVGVK